MKPTAEEKEEIKNIMSNIETMMEQKNIMAIQLAEELGVDKSTISKNLAGKVNTKLCFLLKVAKIFKIPLHQLLK